MHRHIHIAGQPDLPMDVIDLDKHLSCPTHCLRLATVQFGRCHSRSEEAQNENKYKNKRHKTLSNFTKVQNFLLHRVVTNFQVRKRKLLNMQSMQQATKATKSPRGNKKCLQFYTNSIFTVQSCGDKRKTNVRSRNCRHGKIHIWNSSKKLRVNENFSNFELL